MAGLRDTHACCRSHAVTPSSDADLQLLIDAAVLAGSSAGLTQPHPNAACILVDAEGRRVGQAFQWAQGTECPERQVARQAGPAARGATAYFNLESGDCHGEGAGVRALVEAGVARVVVGLRHPLPHARGAAVAALRSAGLEVLVLGEAPCTSAVSASSAAGSTSTSTSSAAGSLAAASGGGGVGGFERAALDACLGANEALLHRAITGRPLGLLKYAMTADGKIATAAGHSAWVSSPESRARVFETRARSDGVVVGGQTVRRDNPRLTTRRAGGHQPARIVMSRTLDLPEDACLWDVAHAPTLVMTQRGARRDFQRRLRGRGVEVVEFDFLTPAGVAAYCAERGFLQLLWECGGTLAAPAIAGGVIHKAMAFIAPKLIGGDRAPTPVGDLGFFEMTQALPLVETGWEVVGPDLLLTGYLPASGGLRALAAAAGGRGGSSANGSAGQAGTAGVASSGASSSSGAAEGVSPRAVMRRYSRQLSGAVEFYKAWDRWGSLGNFSPHPISMPAGPMTPDRLRARLQAARGSGAIGSASSSIDEPGESSSGSTWPSVEHYYQAGCRGGGRPCDWAMYVLSLSIISSQRSPVAQPLCYLRPLLPPQAQKFAGVAHPEAASLVDAIAAAASPEEAARLGRGAQRSRPELVREDWQRSQVAVMYAGLWAKFTTHEGPRRMLLSTTATAGSSSAAQGGGGASGSAPSSGQLLVESSPHDFFWGRGYDDSGQNMLGKLLMELRGELLQVHERQQRREEQQEPAAV
eukprot:scaffold20.g7630.t1